jgi:hypothetical protein
MRLGSLILVLCLAPGGAVIIHALVTTYGAMGSGTDVDSEKLRASVQLGLRWMITGAAVAIALLFLGLLYRLVRPRRRKID